MRYKYPKKMWTSYKYGPKDAYDAGDCGLDECGGRTVNGSYGYYTNSVLPYIPICRMGTKGTVCGFTP